MVVAGEGGPNGDVVGGGASAAEADEARGRIPTNSVQEIIAEEGEARLSSSGEDDPGEYERPPRPLVPMGTCIATRMRCIFIADTDEGTGAVQVKTTKASESTERYRHARLVSRWTSLMKMW